MLNTTNLINPSEISTTQRIALGIEYNGTNYSGWQRQRQQQSVQEYLERAVAKIAGHTISVICAGRTDAGVHACGQVVHFDTSAKRVDLAWVRGVNSYLPLDIRVLWSKVVPKDFNARRSAISRRYCYVIANRRVSPGIMHRAMTWVLPVLDIPAMQRGAQYLVGNHDYSAFRAAECQAKSPVRTIHNIIVRKINNNIIIDVTANAFLHHMVRNIVGTLLAVGKQKFPPTWVQEVLFSKERRLAGLTAPAHGLYLVQVSYPQDFQIPIEFYFPW